MALRSILSSLALAALVGPIMASAVHAATITSSGDSQPYLYTGVGFPPGGVTVPTSGGTGSNSVGGTVYVGNPYNSLDNALFAFALPNLGNVANPFTAATFSVTVSSSTGANAFSYNPGANHYDLYALTARASNAPSAGDFYVGNSDGSASSLQPYFVPYSVAGGNVLTTDTGGSVALLTYLNSVYNSGAGVGEYVLLRINSNYNNASFSGITFDTGDISNDVTIRPTITYAATTLPPAVPEPASVSIIAAASVALLARRRRA